MNREAAALGVPVYSIFKGKIGAVDRYLNSQGRLVLVETEADVLDKVRLERREKHFTPRPDRNDTLDAIVEHIERIYEIAAAERNNHDTRRP